MIKVENAEVFNLENAIRGMRNPLASWDKSDSEYETANICDFDFRIGENDMNLMRRLYKAGSEHRKYLRQIFVSMDIIAPLYWWKEFDTYKVGTVANSCSTMHTIHKKEFTLDDFSCEHLSDESVEIFDDENHYLDSPLDCFQDTINMLNECRKLYLQTKDKKYWWQMIQLLPTSYNQKRTVTMNYENVVTIIRQRTGHKLDEWNDFIKILKELPYVNEIIEDTE